MGKGGGYVVGRENNEMWGHKEIEWVGKGGD